MIRKSIFRSEITEIVILIIYSVLVIGIFSLFFGFGLGGFERQEILSKNGFYLSYGIYFLIGLVAIKAISLFLFKANEQRIEGSIIHDPEQTPLGTFKVIRNPLLLLFLSIIFFSILGWLFTNQQTFFNATPNYEQQFTTGADLFFAVYPASPVETLGALLLISLYGLLLGLFVKKGKLNFTTFVILFVIGSTILSGLFGVINHVARYGFSEVAMRNVALFWAFGGFITALTGSVIPFLVMHDINNFFFRLSTLFSSDVVTGVTIAIIILMIISFALILLYSRKKRAIK